MGVKNKYVGMTLIFMLMCSITYFFLSFLLWDLGWIIEASSYGGLARVSYVAITYMHIKSRPGGQFMVKLAKMIKA